MPDRPPNPKRPRGRPATGRYQPDRDWIAQVRAGLTARGVTVREVARVAHLALPRLRAILSGRICGDKRERNILIRFANQKRSCL
jgi:hypothetical protein